jgi:hypothetical protein
MEYESNGPCAWRQPVESDVRCYTDNILKFLHLIPQKAPFM